MAKITRKVKEKDIENKILDFMNRIQGVFAWKNNTVGIYDPIKKVYRKAKGRHNINGVADILGVMDGKFISIEVKTKTGKQSDDQIDFEDAIKSNGGRYGVARSLSDAIKLLKGWKDEIKRLSK